jgi:predicted Zn-dependent protease
MSKLALAILLSAVFCSCDLEGNSQDSKQERKFNYSYACVDSTVAGENFSKHVDKAGDLIRDLAVSKKDVTDQVQSEYGAAFHKDAIETGTFKLLKDATIQSELETALKKLLAAREKPSAIDYHIYALDDSIVNAFTFGGRIYVTKGMYQKCRGNSALLYSIVGHEIGHSEMGHIKKTIQEMILANKVFGEENGTLAFQIKRMLTGAFNQKNELEADYYGTDLTYELNQDVCSAVTFWQEMSKQENEYSRFEDFLRSHPFSALRAQCLQSHIATNFNRNCSPVIK